MPRGTPKEIAVVLRRRALAMEKAVRETEAASAKEALAIAQKLSQGPYSTVQLRQMGHPYAKRHPRPPQNRAIINLQTGAFLRAWRIRGPRKTTKGLVTKLVNTSPAAQFLAKGTRLMIPRPIEEAIRERLALSRRRRLDQAIRNSINRG